MNDSIILVEFFLYKKKIRLVIDSETEKFKGGQLGGEINVGKVSSTILLA